MPRPEPATAQRASSPSSVVRSYSRYPRNVKLLSSTHSRKARVSARSSGSKSGGVSSRPGDDIVDPLAHLLPVLDRRPHVGEGLFDRLLQVFEHRWLRLAIHLDVDHRLRDGVFVVSVGGEDLDQAALVVAAHLHEGVQDHVYGVALAVYLHPRRIHEEGHVVVDHLHHGVGRLPAVLLEDGVVDPDLRLPRLALTREVPVGDGGPVGVYGGAVFEVVRVHPAVVLAHELLDLRCLILRHLLPYARHDLVQKLVLYQHQHASLGGSLSLETSIIVRR